MERTQGAGALVPTQLDEPGFGSQPASEPEAHQGRPAVAAAILLVLSAAADTVAEAALLYVSIVTTPQCLICPTDTVADGSNCMLKKLLLSTDQWQLWICFLELVAPVVHPTNIMHLTRGKPPLVQFANQFRMV